MRFWNWRRPRIIIPKRRHRNPHRRKKEEVAETKTETRKEEKKPAAAKAPEKKQVSKPVVNRTVRVDIEKLDSLMNLVSELIIAKNSLVAASSNDHGNNTAFNEQIEYLEKCDNQSA